METPKISDSKWLASLVVAAYSDERYDLGEALARLCGQAHRMEQAAAIAPHPHSDERTHEPKHVQELVQRHSGDEPRRPINACQTCGVGIDWSIGAQRWVHVNGDGDWVKSPAPDHDAVPPPATNERDAVAPEPAAETVVTPSGRCIAQTDRGDCHGVIYWAAPAAGLPAAWMHMDPTINGHHPEPNRPDPTR